MRVLFFAQLKDVTGCDSVEIAAVSAWSGEKLWVELIKQFPKLAPHRANVRLARNWEYVKADSQFSDADEVALIPPVSGG